MNHNLAIDWAECALMHRLVPFTLEDFALLVANAESRRYSPEDRHDLDLLASNMGTADFLILFWENPDLMGGPDQ